MNTPGPWFIIHDEPYEMSLKHEDNGRDEKVPGIEIWLDDACYDGNPERMANARLAAAAPDMKSALETVLFGLTDDITNNNGKVDFDGLIKTVKAALAKAEGT